MLDGIFFQTPEEHKKACPESRSITSITVNNVSMPSGRSKGDSSESVNGISSNEVLFNDNCSFASEPEMLVVMPDIPDC